MKNKSLRQFVCLAMLVIVLVGCDTSPSAPANIRAGEWKASSDIGTLTLSVNDSGTAITQAVVNYECSSGAVSLSESVTINGPDNGWLIKNNRFIIDMMSSAQIKIQGTFNNANTKLTGSFTARNCSSNMESTR